MKAKRIELPWLPGYHSVISISRWSTINAMTEKSCSKDHTVIETPLLLQLLGDSLSWKKMNDLKG